ncbi:hypothetical protein Rhe02_50870 [Rhizocola hellebori]|uniref:SAF domain-containing protein n=2 Tax=Rhizocola hellebori TaxID=1392758 RepID=A0A8J3QAN9_9ACTN|nr:hypothetical protein Rhe02_50870 [Rhizocola hellebori]
MQGALAVLLIIAGALTAGYVAQRMGSTHDFLGVAREVGKGGKISAEDLMIIRVNDAIGLKPIPSSRAGSVIGKHAVMALVPGTLLTMDQVTEIPIPAPGHQLIGLGLEEDQMPSSRLDVGVNVLLVVVPPKNQVILPDKEGATAADLVPPRTFNATVIDLKPGTKQGLMLINVEVTTADAPTVAALASDDRIVIALAGN